MTTPVAARRAAIVGSPVAHSLSPVLHATAYAELDLDWSYQAVEVGAGRLAAFVAGLDDAWAGLSVTMPLKAEALALAATASATARRARAANTLVRTGSGWSADNTDVPGMVAALRAAGIEQLGAACVLGAGATARSAVIALEQLGVTDLALSARDPDRARLLGRDLAPVDTAERPPAFYPWADPRALAAPVVVATVPRGATDALTALVPRDPGVLFDVLYDPWPTPLAAAWVAAGGRVIGGLDLLVHQAALQVQLMTGRTPAVAGMAAAGAAALAARA